MKHSFLFIRLLTLLLFMGNSLSAQFTKTPPSDTYNRDMTTVHIKYNCETQNFDTPPPACVHEYQQVVVRYTHVNPFLHNSHLKVEQIEGKWDNGMTAFDKINEIVGSEKAGAEAGKKVAEDPKAETVKPAGKGLAKPIRPAAANNDLVRLLNEKIQLLNTLQAKLTSLERTIYTVDQIVQLDTVIKVARKNQYNRSRTLMGADIANRTTLKFNTGADIQRHFDTQISDIKDTLKAANTMVANLEVLNTKLTLIAKEHNFSSAINDMKTNINKVATAYSGENLSTLVKNVTAIKNNYQNSISAEYEVRGDSVICARGDYLQINDIGMGIDFSPIKIKDGTRIDFSVGLAVNIGDVTGWNYTLNKVNDSTIYLITDKENRILVPSPVVMVHWYVTRCKNAAWMLSFGVSPDIITLTDAKFFVGGGIGGFSSNKIMRRFVISAGVSFGAADVLKAKYRNKDREPNNNFHSFGNISDSDLTEKSYRAGGFLSFTWNLGGIGH